MSSGVIPMGERYPQKQKPVVKPSGAYGYMKAKSVSKPQLGRTRMAPKPIFVCSLHFTCWFMGPTNILGVKQTGSPWLPFFRQS